MEFEPDLGAALVRQDLATQGSGKRGKRVRQNGTQRSGAQVNFVEVCLVSSELESSMPCTEICNVTFYRGFPELRRKGRCRGIARSYVRDRRLIIGLCRAQCFTQDRSRAGTRGAFKRWKGNGCNHKRAANCSLFARGESPNCECHAAERKYEW